MKLRIIEGIALSIVVLFDIIMINHSYELADYKENKDNRSTANYIEITNTEQEKKVEEIKQEVIMEIEEEEKVEEQEIIQDPIVFDGKTMNELSEQLNKSLNSSLSGKGYLIASKSLEYGVDPYMATAIILQETGCKWNCSALVKNCNNVGGQKGSGCGSYSYFESLDAGIEAFISNLYRNYIAQGLTTLEAINTKYAASTQWSVQVNNYIESIKAQ